MKISKGRKITAFFTLSIMLVAIVAVTAGVLTNTVPKTYQGEDVAPTTTALNYKIDQAEYTLSNASLAYLTFYSGQDGADLKILFPNTIYIDNSENLSDTGYYFAYDVWVKSKNNYKNRAVLWDNMFGYFNTSGGATTPSGNSATMQNVFYNYGAVSRTFNGTDLSMSSDTWSSSKNLDDNGVNSTNSAVIVEGRDLNQLVTIPIKGTVNSEYQSNGTTARTATFEHGCGKYQMALAQWYSDGWFGSNQWEDLGKQAHFGNWNSSGAAGTNIFHGISPFNDDTKYNNNTAMAEYDNRGYRDIINGLYSNLGSTCGDSGKSPNDIKVNIYIYDKSRLDAAVKRFEDKYDLLVTLNGNNTVAEAAKSYLTERKKVLTDREVTQTEINTATDGLNSYKFDLAVPTDEEQSASRGSAVYNGSSRTLASATLGRFGTDSNKYFNFQYKLNGTTVSEIKNAGEYEVYAQPKTVDNMIFRWSDGTTNYKKIGTYAITPAQMSLKSGVLKSNVTYKYENKDFNVTATSALLSGTSFASTNFNNYYNATDNPLTVYVSTTDADCSGATANNTVTFKNVGGPYTVYYKITANNHSDVKGSFTVTIAKADMTVKSDTVVASITKEFKNSPYSIALTSTSETGVITSDNFDSYYPDGNPMTIVYVLGGADDELADVDWSTAASSVDVKEVGNYVVFYKATADNHNDYTSSFEVEIEKANIQLTVDAYSQVYGDTLLISDGIIDNMLSHTAQVLDATSWTDIKAYIKDICSFGVSGTTLAEGYVKAGSYAISYTKNADWNDRIATITFINDASKAYVVNPKEVQVTWTQKADMYYNAEGGKRPSAAISGNDLVPGTTASLSAVRITGPGVDFEGNPVALIDGHAIYAGTYEAYVTCSNTNYDVAEASKKCNFEILRRPITVELQDRERVYASKGNAAAVWNKYTTTDLANNTNNEVYAASIDTALVRDDSGVLVDAATKVFEINHNATESDFTSTAESERYFKVKTYELTLTLLNKNYEFTNASKTTANFVIEPAEIDCDLQSISNKVYNGQPQNLVLPNDNTNVTMQGYEVAHRDSIKIQYRATESGSYSDTLLTRKDVGTTTVYYKITADNHNALEGSFTATVIAVNVRVGLTHSNVKATYGDAVPTSAQLVERLGITLNWTSEATRIADVYDRIAFAVSGMTDRRANAGDYSLTHRYIGEEVGKNNFNITYIDDCGIDAYTIEPKPLYIEWKQTGTNWAESGMEYYYDGKAPVFTPVAPDTLEDGSENVVVIDGGNRDTVLLAEIQLKGRTVGEYTVSTSLSDPTISNNYTIQNATATFNIIPRVVKIYAKNQTAVYGRASAVALGELEAVDTKWAYPSDVAASAKFLSDDYSAFALASDAQTPLEGQSYRDTGNYDIVLEILDETVAANYDVEIVTEGAPDGMQATFTITPASIHFGAKRFNIDYDNPDENNFVTVKQMKDTVDTTLGTDPDEFTVTMSDLFQEEDAKFGSIANVGASDWVTDKTRTIVDIDDIGVYYVWVRVEHHCKTHNHSNYETFETKVQVNILSGWASIKIKNGGISNAQYGDPVHTSLQIFNGLKENLEVYGGIKIKVDEENEIYKEFTLDILEEYVTKGWVRFYVLNSDATEMKRNAAFGEYTIEIEVVDGSQEFKNFRFLDANAKANTDAPTTNIGAYKVGKREIGVDWGQMDEVYGEHSESSPSHTYTLTNVMTRDGVKDDVHITVEYSKKINGVWTVVKHSETLSVGQYKVTVKTVSHPDYKLPDAGIEKLFSINKRTVIITISDRSLTYGDNNAKRDTIETYLNTRIQDFDRYTVVGKNADGTMQAGKYDFLDGDAVADIFTFKIGDYTLDSKYSYLFAGDYGILIEKNDNGVGANYDVQVQGSVTAKLTINESTKMTYARDFITSKVYQGKEINVVDPLSKVFDYINLVGDGDKLLEGKDPKTIVEYKLKGEDDSKYSSEYKVKDAGDYKVIIKVDAPNHTVQEFEVDLTVAKAYVVINMTGVAEKEYGDTEAQVLAKEEDSSIDTFSKWLVKYCKITLTAYTENGGDEIEVENIYNDFEFKVVAKGTGNSDALEIGAYKVGTYRVHHRTSVEKDGKRLMDNYEVDYVEVAGSQNGYCNAEVYKINPKIVTQVNWATTGHIAGVENKFEFSNSRPSITATYTLIGESTASDIPLKYTMVQGESGKEDVVDYGVGKYIAQIEIDTDNVKYAKFANYDFDGVKAYDFEIVAKNVTVIIKNQSSEYGETKVGEWDWSDQFTRVEAGIFAGNPVELSIECETDKQYYGVGTYHIVGKCVSHNYNLTFKGEDENGQAGVNDYAIFEVTPTEMSVSHPTHSVSYSGKAFSVDVKSILAANEKYTIKGDVLWSDAIVTYEQEDGSYTSDIAVIEGLTSGNGLVVKYKVQLANHVDYTSEMTIEIIPAKLVINISKGATSVYGDALLTSDRLFEYATLDTEKSSIKDIDIDNLKELFDLKVSGTTTSAAGKVNKGTYNISYRMKSGYDTLYDVELVGEEGAYSVVAKTLTVNWTYPGAFVYDGSDKEISCELVGVIGEDVVDIDDLTDYIFTDAGDYVAKASKLNNNNYVLASGTMLEWVINPKSIEIDWVEDDLTYNGAAHTLTTPTIKDNQLVAGDDCDIVVKTQDAVNAGSHTATAISNNGNYVISNNTDTFTYVIKQAPIGITWSNTTLTYNGNEQAPTAQVDGGGLFGEDKCNVVVGGAQKNAGDNYTATATLDNANYKIADDATCEFKINAKAITFTWQNTDTLKYTGEAQTPDAVAVGAEGDDEIEFVIEGAQVNAGTGYTATVTGVKNGNYTINQAQQSSMTTNYSIGKGTNEFIELVLPEISDGKLPWSGSDKPDAKWGDVTVKYYSDAECTQEVTDIANAGEGTYWVKLIVAGTDNYDEISQTFEVVLEGGLNIVIVIIGAVVSLILLVGAVAVVKSTNKKKQKGVAV